MNETINKKFIKKKRIKVELYKNGDKYGSQIDLPFSIAWSRYTELSDEIFSIGIGFFVVSIWFTLYEKAIEVLKND